MHVLHNKPETEIIRYIRFSWSSGCFFQKQAIVKHTHTHVTKLSLGLHLMDPQEYNVPKYICINKVVVRTCRLACTAITAIRTASLLHSETQNSQMCVCECQTDMKRPTHQIPLICTLSVHIRTLFGSDTNNPVSNITSLTT